MTIAPPSGSSLLVDWQRYLRMARLLLRLPAAGTRAAAAAGLGLIDVVTVIAAPFASARIVDALVARTSDVVWWSAVMAAVAAIHVICAVSYRLVVVRLEQGVGHELRRRTFGRLIGRESTADDLRVGDALSRTVSDTAVLQPVAGAAIQGVVDVLTVLAAAAALLWMHPTMALSILAISLLSTWWLGRWSPVVESRAKTVREGGARVAEVAQGWLSRRPAVIATSLEGVAAHAFTTESEAQREKNLSLGRLLAYVGGSNSALVLVPSTLVFVFGGQLVLRGTLSLGELVAFSTVAGYFTGPVQRLLRFKLATATAIPAFERIALTEFEAMPAPARLSSPVRALQVDAATFLCNGNLRIGVPALRLQRGEVTLLTGRNGAGKTSLGLALLGLHTLEAGEAVLQLEDGRTSVLGRNDQVGSLPQEVSLFPGSLLNNVALFDETPDMVRAELAVRESGLSSWVAGLSSGLQSEVDPSWSARMSGGQLRKLGWARLLYRTPSVLVLDEPWADLDPQASDQFDRWLDRVRDTSAVLVIAHSVRSRLPIGQRVELRRDNSLGELHVCSEVSNVESSLQPTEGPR